MCDLCQYRRLLNVIDYQMFGWYYPRLSIKSRCKESSWQLHVTTRRFNHYAIAIFLSQETKVSGLFSFSCKILIYLNGKKRKLIILSIIDIKKPGIFSNLIA